MKYLYTDIDGVLSLIYDKQKNTEWGYVFTFNSKAVKAYNHILEQTDAQIIISSDWKYHYSLEQLQNIFLKFAKIVKAPIDITPSLWGTKYTSLYQLEECRAEEILMHVKQYKPIVWVAIDDLNLSKWINEDNFVHLPRSTEGIKQTGKVEKVIKLLNTYDKS